MAIKDLSSNSILFIRLVVIIIKIIAVSMFLTIAIRGYMNKEKKCSILSLIMGLYILMVREN